jgi:hypothetical protein
MALPLIVGWVTRFDPQKGFGFAEADVPGMSERSERLRIFFHRNDARVVDVGKYPEFILTDQPNPTASPTGHGRNPTRIVMQLRHGKRGWRATRWGIRPGQMWVYDFLAAKTARQENTLAPFIGGDLTVTTGGKLSTAGTITALQLRPLCLTVTVDGARRHYDLTSAYQRFVGGDIEITCFDGDDKDVVLRFHK